MNWIDTIILLIVVAIICGVITFSILSHKRGGGSCSKCAYAKDCNKQNKKTEANSSSKQSSIETDTHCPCCQKENKNTKKQINK